MPLPDIQLDDRRFEDLVAEAKRRIPGYTPEWTDFNESDPGITLVQLFAWLEEMILWRLNRVPDKNFVKFLELVGIQLQPPASAQAELTFKLTTKDLRDPVLIPQGTQVSLADQVKGGPVIFETDDNLYAVGAELAALQSFDSAEYQLLNEANRVDGKFFYAFGPTPQAGAALYLGFDRSFPTGRFGLTVHAYIADLIDEGKGILAPPPSPGHARATPSAGAIQTPPPVIAYWEYWAGDTAKWKRLTVVLDGTASLTRTGVLTFEAPADMQTTKLGLLQKDGDQPLYWFRYRIDQVLGAGYEVPPRLEDVLLNTIKATNAVTVTDELLGASNGGPNQTFRLSKTPVLPASLVLEVDEGEGLQPWTEVRDFAASTRTDQHYTLDLATGQIAFGNGEQGKIPRALPDDSPNIKATTYRWGGGAKGNGGAKKITSLQSAVPYVDTVTNLRPAEGGQDEETLAAAEERAPQTIQTQWRAVTANDFEFLTKQTPGARIRRAKALPLRNPNFELVRPAGSGLPESDVAVPGVVSIIIVPDSLDPKPLPTEETLTIVAEWLNNHRLITTELYVIAPKYRLVQIDARVIAAPTASSGQLALALTQKLLDYFHPLHGGTDGTGWEFGGTIYFSETYRQILTTSGVARVEAGAVTTYVDDKPIAGCTDFKLGSDELVYSIKHTIRVSYA